MNFFGGLLRVLVVTCGIYTVLRGTFNCGTCAVGRKKQWSVSGQCTEGSEHDFPSISSSALGTWRSPLSAGAFTKWCGCIYHQESLNGHMELSPRRRDLTSIVSNASLLVGLSTWDFQAFCCCSIAEHILPYLATSCLEHLLQFHQWRLMIFPCNIQSGDWGQWPPWVPCSC